ncbi:uncharacterized protein LOC134195926 isoform X1 [Corticium candelabrum]|uniref:uncharacterized protein LOC134195926 isoform X1 n=1 Tax=Corticium candelabrum TaxID=121492 RepID=UPI002E26F89F|nr:uncharacterized protein LOC134195926 isoform X1 [Corticium candelabrum]
MSIPVNNQDDACGACHCENKQTMSLISLVSTNRRGPLGLFRQTGEQERCRGNNRISHCRYWWRREPTGKYCEQTLLDIDHIRSSLRALPTVAEYKELLSTPCGEEGRKTQVTCSSQSFQTRSAWIESSRETISGCQVAGVVDMLLKKRSDDALSFTDEEILVDYGRHRSRISGRHSKNM